MRLLKFIIIKMLYIYFLKVSLIHNIIPYRIFQVPDFIFFIPLFPLRLFPVFTRFTVLFSFYYTKKPLFLRFFNIQKVPPVSRSGETFFIVILFI